MKFHCVTTMHELERKRPFYGLRIVWPHWSHNERIYIGIYPERWWRLRWRTFPWSLKSSVHRRRTEKR